MIRSIRRRVALTTLVSTIGLLALMGVTVYFGIRHVLISQLDRSLREEIRLIAAMVDTKEGEIELDFEGLDHAGTPRGEDEAFLQLWDPEGTVLYRSDNLAEADLPRTLISGREPAFEWVEHPAARLRCAGVGFLPRVDPEVDNGTHDEFWVDNEPVPEVQVVLGRRGDSVSNVLSDLLTILAGSGALLIGGAMLLSLALARAGLRPLRQFASQISEIDDRSLSARLDVAQAPAEVAPVGERLNELLDRVESALERERAFSADIAHELRTPLASLRSTVDVALRRPREEQSDREAFEDTREATRRLQALVDRLLWLVRLDAGAVEIDVQPTELTSLLEETWKTLEPDAAARGLKVDWDLPPELHVASDPMLAGIVLRNVLENAVAYADEGGQVRIRATERSGEAAIEVTNSGSRVRQEEVDSLLRRFTRGDKARTLVGSRCGLGLALVETITAVLGHGIEIRTNPGGTFAVNLSMGAAT